MERELDRRGPKAGEKPLTEDETKRKQKDRTALIILRIVL